MNGTVLLKTAMLPVIFLLAVSCGKNPSEPAKQEGTAFANCATIHIRTDGGSTFYENNPTYQNVENDAFQWAFSNSACFT